MSDSGLFPHFLLSRPNILRNFEIFAGAPLVKDCLNHRGQHIFPSDKCSGILTDGKGTSPSFSDEWQPPLVGSQAMRHIFPQSTGSGGNKVYTPIKILRANLVGQENQGAFFMGQDPVACLEMDKSPHDISVILPLPKPLPCVPTSHFCLLC